MRRFNWRNPTCPNVFNWQDLMKIRDPSECGRIIHLEHTPTPKQLGRLKDVLSQSNLEKIILIGCFSNAKDTSEVLSALNSNRSVKKAHLNLRWNAYNDECIKIMGDLVSRDAVRSLECPNDMDAVSAEKLLEVITKTEKMNSLRLNGAILNEHSLKYIEVILSERKIADNFSMANSRRTSEASLTSDDFDKLNDAYKRGKRWFKFKLKIEWFSYVGSIDFNKFPSAKVMFKSSRDYFFDRKTKMGMSSKLEVVRMSKTVPWQLVKPGSKRSRYKEDEAPKKRQKMDDDVDNLIDGFNVQIGDSGSSPKNKADREIDGVAENNPPHPRCFDSPPGPSATEQQGQQHAATQPPIQNYFYKTVNNVNCANVTGDRTTNTVGNRTMQTAGRDMNNIAGATGGGNPN